MLLASYQNCKKNPPADARGFFVSTFVSSKVSDLLFTVSKMTRFQEKTRVETDIKTADIKQIGYISAFLILVEARGIEPLAKQLKYINITLIQIVRVHFCVQ